MTSEATGASGPVRARPGAREKSPGLIAYALMSIAPELVPDAGALPPLAEAGPGDDAGPLGDEAGADDWPF